MLNLFGLVVVVSDSSSYTKNDIFIDLNNDEDMKILGELSATKSGREMIKLLVDKKMYSNEIGKNMGLDSSMTSYYLKKMEALKMLKITYGKIFQRGKKEHRFFDIPASNIVINLRSEKDEKKGLKKIFKEGVKFASIGIAFVASSIISKNHFKVIETNYPAAFGADIPQTTINNLEFWIYPLIVLVVALIIERIIFGIKKRKRG